MTKPSCLCVLTALFIFTILPGPGAGFLRGAKGKKNESFRIRTADRQEISGGKYIASGDVEISWDDYRIYADYLEFDRETKNILAQGRVTMASSETVITGEKLTFNLKEKTGELYDTYGQLAPTVRYTTNQLKQLDKDTMAFKKLDFTACSQCVPRWKISCANGKIKKDKYIEMKHALFKIKKIPVFYLPYLRYPIEKDGRSTGFLIPRMGHSTIKKFFISNAFFWAINPNMDLTLHYDHYANAGNGLAQEFRYLSPNMEGKAKLYYFKYSDQNLLKPGADDDYYLKIIHRQDIDFLNTKIKMDIDRQSDPNFLRLLSTDIDTQPRRTSGSTVSISSAVSNLKFSISGSESETFYVSSNKLRRKRYLPSVKLNLNQQKIWILPGYFSLAASYQVISTEGESFEEKDEGLLPGVKSKRLSLKPSYSVRLVKLPWMSAGLSLQAGYSFYPQSKDPAITDTVVVVPEPLHLFNQTAVLTLKGPVFSRIFNLRGGKIRHLIEPGVKFRYAAKYDDEDLERILPVDTYDHPSYSYVQFSLTTRLLYKSNKNTASNKKGAKISAREILSYTVKQSYYFEPKLASRGKTLKLPLGIVLDSDTGEEEMLYDKIYPDFSQLSNTLRFRPVSGASLDATVVYNYYLKKFTRIRFSLGYTNKKSIIRGNFSYNRNINQYREPDFEYNRDTVGGGLFFDAPRFPLKLSSRVNYDVTNGQWSNGSVRLGFDYQCVRFYGELKIFKFLDQTDTQFVFGFTFGNLGSVREFLK